MIIKRFCKSLAFMTFFAAAPAVYAAGDTLTPDEVQVTGVSSKPSNDSGIFIGAGATFGQGRTTDPGATPATAYLLQVEPGYQASTGSWSRFELSLELFTGQVGYRLPDDQPLGGKVSYNGLFGGLAKVGYGYSLGNDMVGVLKAGVGPASATIAVSPTDSGKLTSDRLTGLAWTLGWELVAPVTTRLDFTAGVNWTQFQFDVSSIGQVHIDRTFIANMPAADVGLRVRL
jgi:hypothetical protein